jgi:hypothetical protein
MAGPVRAATYVVDQAAPGAADMNPETEEKPFKTVQHAADVARPGDTVYVMADKDDESVRVKGGVEGKPIIFRAMPRRSATVSGFDLQASYLRIEGFNITAARPARGSLSIPKTPSGPEGLCSRGEYPGKERRPCSFGEEDEDRLQRFRLKFRSRYRASQPGKRPIGGRLFRPRVDIGGGARRRGAPR